MIPSTNKKLLISEDWTKIYQSFKSADFKSYDFDTLRRTMISYLQENYPEDFNDFIESSEYIALIDLIAYLGQNLSFRIDLNARENFLETAQRRDSILRLAQLVGYNPSRNTPSHGFLKVVAVNTSESVYDANGINLADTTISWNDSTNSNWYQQFLTVLNSAMTTSFGRSTAKKVIDGINSEQYYINSSNLDVPVYNFSKSIGGTSMTFEVVPASFENKDYIFELPPKPANLLSFIYKNDNQGSGSANTGFFFHFRQGTLGTTSFTLDNPVPNEIVGVNVPNINNTDIWLWQLDYQGNFEKLWTQVPSILGNNVIYNSLDKSIRTLFAVGTRVDDQVDLNFADGVFGDLPKGEFRLFYRQSNGLTYTIKPEQLSGIIINVPYVNAQGQANTLQITLSLQYTVSNSVGSESNATIQLKAPQTFYTQNRMITAEDYNISPLNAGSDIIKVKSVNRISSGISRYFDLSDVSGNYSKTNIFANDGILYKEESEDVLEFNASNNILGVIKGPIAEIISSNAMKSFYYENWNRISIYGLALKWKLVNTLPGQTRGYFYNSNGVFSVSSNYTDNELRFLNINSLVKFLAPAGKYFDEKNNLKTIVGNSIPLGGKQFLWSSVTQIINDGATLLDDGTGPLIFGSYVPDTAIPVQIIPTYQPLLTFSLENEINNQCKNLRNFGLTINNDTRSWEIILNSNIDIVSSFSLNFQENTQDQGLDASWLIAFIWTGSKYRVRYRLLNYIFESEKETAFYVDNNEKNYDYVNNILIKDLVNILSINVIPTSITAGKDTGLDALISLPADWFLYTGQQKVDYFNANGVSATDLRNIGETEQSIQAAINLGLGSTSNITNSLTTSFPLNFDRLWQIDNPIVETDGYVQPNKVKVSLYNSSNSSIVIDPNSFTDVVGNNYIFFKKNNQDSGYSLTREDIIILNNEREILDSYKIDGQLFYFKDSKVVKYWSIQFSNVVYTDQYKGRSGRSDIKFQYTHHAGSQRRLDPSKTNIIDIYVLTSSYDTEFKSYIQGNLMTQPLAPTSQSLEQNYSEYLNQIKSISDEIIYHPVKYKILFGRKAPLNLQATFKAVRNTNRSTNDNNLKSRILTAINEFFALENWDFGQSFYFSELSTYVMNQLTPDITNFVIVPVIDNGFGSFYEIACQMDEIFINGTSIENIEIINNVTPVQLKASNNLITST